MHNEFELFTQKTNEGNYLEAREIVLALNQKMEEMNDHVIKFCIISWGKY